jgi:hypothetical protein
MTFARNAYATLISACALGCSAHAGQRSATDHEPSFGTDASMTVIPVDSGPEHDDAGSPAPAIGDASAPKTPDPYALANGCYTLQNRDGTRLVAPSDDSFVFDIRSSDEAAKLFLKASDLGTYLFYDHDARYVYAENGPLQRQATLLSDILTMDDGYISGAEWELLPLVAKAGEPGRFRVRQRKTQLLLGPYGLTHTDTDAVELAFEPAIGCSEHPELSLDAEGSVQRTSFADGTLYGIVETHSHILTNFGFGGGGVFHGAPFHRLGVAHALPDCEMFHGPMGRKDFFGYAFSSQNFDVLSLLPALLTGQLGADNHHTDGYPTFTDWPNGPTSPTHQTQYYRWLERAWLAGLRLVVQLATTNQIICDFMVGQGYQPVRYSCSDMVGVDRQLDEVRNLERYIDAQAGGPGKGFFRIVTTPAEARAVVLDGKLAVILGIETSNLFDCFSVPHAGAPTCDLHYVQTQLDAYRERGVRGIFPVHKYDNAFSAGDGNRGFIEIGNFLNSGQWSNFVLDCPSDAPAVFDHGAVEFGGLNEPRERYDSAPPNDMSGFASKPLLTVTPYMLRLTRGKLDGEYCQKAGLTELGEQLLHEMMKRGMLIELDHLPSRSYARAMEIFEERDYPPIASHGNYYHGEVYALGGVSRSYINGCRDPMRKGAMTDTLREHLAIIQANGGYPAEGFGMDLNGLAGAARPRFGPQSGCSAVQEDPVTYPFKSFAGDITFTEPRIGTRYLDFNNEGLVHVGLMAELLEDARRDADDDAQLLPLFRSAEGYIRAWERAEARGEALNH